MSSTQHTTASFAGDHARGPATAALPRPPAPLTCSQGQVPGQQLLLLDHVQERGGAAQPAIGHLAQQAWRGQHIQAAALPAGQ